MQDTVGCQVELDLSGREAALSAKGNGDSQQDGRMKRVCNKLSGLEAGIWVRYSCLLNICNVC